ncbi:hypothetical protein ACJBU6_00917 [Exserohilum turcicum]
MPHLPRASALSAFRAAPRFRAPVTKRFFTPSAYNMTIKAYFDCTWSGPTVEIDQAGTVTKTGEVAGSYAPWHPGQSSPEAMSVTDGGTVQNKPAASTLSSLTM